MHFFFFFFNDTATTEIYTLSLHDALPISRRWGSSYFFGSSQRPDRAGRASLPTSTLSWRSCSASSCRTRSEEHTSELQSPCNLVCRLLLEKKKNRRTRRSRSARRH